MCHHANNTWEIDAIKLWTADLQSQRSLVHKVIILISQVLLDSGLLNSLAYLPDYTESKRLDYPSLNSFKRVKNKYFGQSQGWKATLQMKGWIIFTKG